MSGVVYIGMRIRADALVRGHRMIGRVLPYDYTRCLGEGCGGRETCLRHKALADDTVMMSISGNLSALSEDCRGFADCDYRIEEV